MGFFDVLSPSLNWFDAVISDLVSPAWRLAFWAWLTAFLSAVVFHFLVNHQRNAELKHQTNEVQKQIQNHGGDFKELKVLGGRAIHLAFKRFALLLWPTWMAFMLALFIIVFVSNQYSHQRPVSNQNIEINMDPVGLDLNRLSWRDGDGRVTEFSSNALSWPNNGQIRQLIQDDKLQLLQLPMAANVNWLHKKQWWNWLVANPAGYLPSSSIIDNLHFNFDTPMINWFNSGFHSQWPLWFFSHMLLVSLLTLLILKPSRS